MKAAVTVSAGTLILALAVGSTMQADLGDARDDVRTRAAAGLAVGLVSPATYLAPTAPVPLARYRATLNHLRPSVGGHARTTRSLAPVVLNEVVKKNCAGCHSDQRKMGNFSLQSFDLATVGATSPIIAEKMIGKLRTGMMPPPGRPRPAGDTLEVLTETLERQMDALAVRKPDIGRRSFQRLNRAEYERAIKDLLTLSVNAESWLPLDTKSANFDNIADVQIPSATVLEAYLDAASAVSRMAVGDAKATVSTSTYKVSRLANQNDYEGNTPVGTRGGTAATHYFPADGAYVFSVSLHSTPIGQLVGGNAPFDEQLEFSVDGQRVALLDIDRGMHESEPNGLDLKTVPITVKAGPHVIAAAYVRTFEGPVEDLMTPIGNSLPDTQIGIQDAITIQGHMKLLSVTGPFNPTGVSDTPSRRRVFTCRPLSAAEQRPCAEKIVNRLGSLAYRRPLTVTDRTAIMRFYDEEAKDGGFENGVRGAVEAILASPAFVFRAEEVAATAKPGTKVAVASTDLASRLSFFLWGTLPDSTLNSVAQRGLLNDTTVLVAQAKRMLADPRADALATRFAAQWLRLQDIEKVHPDPLLYPAFNLQLAKNLQQETELFMASLVRENRSLLDMYTADYTYVNDELARHYGMNDVVGSDFRRVTHTDKNRVGILGHGSVLLLTSQGNRTSPVLRGKWVMEVLMGSPPPPPPPNVPDLEVTGASKEGRMLTTRQRMEEHRDNASCRSCHQFIDPIGLALDNFDVIGQWRIKENNMPLDTRGDYYDGTKITGPRELQQVLLKRPVPLVRTFVTNLMAYAVGRRVEYSDGPAIRKIEASVKARNYRIQDVVLGVVKSDAFRMRMVPVAQAALPASGASVGHSR